MNSTERDADSCNNHDDARRAGQRLPWAKPSMRQVSAASAEVGPVLVSVDGAFTTS